MSNLTKFSLKTGPQHFAGKSVAFGDLSKVGVALVAALVVMVGFNLMGVEAVRLPVVSVLASADDGNVAANTLDGSLSTRWSALGDGQWIRFDLGATQTVGSVKIAWYNGNQRRSSFDLQTSDDGTSWTTVYNGQSSGSTLALEDYPTVEKAGRYVRVLGHGNSESLWNSISEVEIYTSAVSGGGPLTGLRLLVDPVLGALHGSLNGVPVALQWDRVPGATYQLQASSNLVTWQNVGAAFTNTAAAQVWNEDASALSMTTWPKRFYRVKRAALPAPVANFSASALFGVVPLAVQFTDQSTGNPVAWNWTFGDGATSTAQNPSHLYLVPGDYTATLTVRNSAGETSTKSETIKATLLPQGGDLPSDVLDLSNWKVTLPIDTSHAGSPDEYRQPELDGYEHPDYFHVNDARDGVVFTAHCGGYTTSGSGYPRSELREMTSNGSANASWSTTSGTHTMEIRQKVTHLPVAKPHVVVGQIHDAGDDVIVFRLEGSTLFVDENGERGPVLTSNYQLGTEFTVKFVVRNGGVECYYNGQYIYTYQVSTSGCYFKAGCYTQSNTSRGDAPTAYGQVIIYDLSVTHQ